MFIRGRRLFHCGCPKVRRLLEEGVYLRPSAIRRKTIIVHLTQNFTHSSGIYIVNYNEVNVVGVVTIFKFIFFDFFGSTKTTQMLFDFSGSIKNYSNEFKLTLQKRIKAAATDTVVTRTESSVHKEKVGLVWQVDFT